jgi:large subunit ribosomal protein L13
MPAGMPHAAPWTTQRHVDAGEPVSTYFPTTESARASRKWVLIDATGLTLGRMATAAARILMGKHRSTWTPFLDAGDFVVIVNCEKAVLTGRKAERKLYRHHTGYPGGLKEVAAGDLRKDNPVRMVELAVCGMLPKTRLGRAMAKKLKVHAGPEHPHAAQQPETLDLGLPRAGAESN